MSEIKVGGPGFQRVKQPLRFALHLDCAMHNIVDFHCALHYVAGAGTFPDQHISPGKESVMVKVEDIQQYGKEHLETVVASANTLQSGLQAIATAYGDYAKKSFEDGRSFVEKLAGV